MENLKDKRLLKFLIRFTIIYFLSYLVFDFLITNIAFFDIFHISTKYIIQSPKTFEIMYLSQIIRGLLLALIIYPTVDVIFQSEYRVIHLIGLIWGLSTLCSIQTIPGSIEGFIYTIIPIKIHLLMLMKDLFFVILFVSIFINVEKKLKYNETFHEIEMREFDDRFWGYLKRFVIIYVIAYFLMGIIFMVLQDYQIAFETMENFKYFRSLDSKIVQFATLFQIIRGSIIAIILYPLYNKLFSNKNGWFYIFILIYGLTFITSSGHIAGIIHQLFYLRHPLKQMLIGLPEVTFQMLFFSLSFYFWERKHSH